ncbi:MAG: HD domain-containing protein [Planctomycetota bacterium]
MSTSSLWQSAAAFAARAHRHQTRRDDRTPYMVHPARVALIVAVEFGCTDETVLAAALLHDVLEDTTADFDDLLEHFGPEVADLVSCLSKDNRLVESEREKKYDERLAKGPWQARLIKLADVHDNLADAATGEEQQTLLKKVRRAVALAENDPPLQKAVEIVRERMQAAELRLSSA